MPPARTTLAARTLGEASRLTPEGLALLRELLEVGGVSGGEEPAATVLRRAWAPLADEVGQDALGSLWALRRAARRGPGAAAPLLVFAAHLDMIGVVVTRLLPGGFLRFAPVGGLDRRSLLGRELLLQGRRPVPAVVATLPPHLSAVGDRRRLPPVEDLCLDTGLGAEELAAALRPGDRGRLVAPAADLLGGRLRGVGLDNRVGVATLHETLLGLRGADLPCDLCVLANVQEEAGLRGIAPAGRHLRPTAAVVVDTGFGAQAGVAAHEGFPCGRGPVLGVGPALHPAVTALLDGVAGRRALTLAREVIAGDSGTDAWALQVAAGGVPVGLLSIPIRSMHTPGETVDTADVAAAAGLLADAALAADRAWAAGLVTALLPSVPAVPPGGDAG